ncbi:MAG: hypothetical protein ABJG47_01380 [Ekhidna sp.]
MRIIISLIFLLVTLTSFSQRISFEDPDLVFSFEKPKKWEVFDDGYVVKVSPSEKDTASTYFTITYFEDAESFGFFPRTEPAINPHDIASPKINIDGEVASLVEKKQDNSFLNTYTFQKYGQRFEIKTLAASPKTKRIFRKIIRSLRITK